MREYMKAIQTLLEAENDKKKTKVRDKTVDDMAFDMDNGETKGDLTNPVNDAPPPARHQRAPGERARLPGAAASRAATNRGSMGDNAGDSLRFFNHLLSRGTEDEISDEEAALRAADGETPTPIGAEPVPVTPENLPQVINQAMFDPNREGAPPAVAPPKWHMVKQLPGYMQAGIRAMGRMVFSPFTDTPIEDIQVMASMLDERDVRVMADWIRNNGVKDDEATITAEEILPGYGAQIQVWNAEDCTFMLVKDHAGSYIYGWPGGRGVHLDAAPDYRRLESTQADETALVEKKDKPERDVGDEVSETVETIDLEKPTDKEEIVESSQDDGTADYFAKLAGVRSVPKRVIIEDKDVADLAILAGIRK